jgi:preprotein translocase subunit SecE
MMMMMMMMVVVVVVVVVMMILLRVVDLGIRNCRLSRMICCTSST